MTIQVGDTIQYKERDADTPYLGEVIEIDNDPKEELPFQVRKDSGETLWLFRDEVVGIAPTTPRSSTVSKPSSMSSGST